MASYKRFKSLAHNVAHSFLSLMNYVDDDYVVEDLFQRARSARTPCVTIDLLTGAVEPPAVRTPRVLTSVARTREWLPFHAKSEGCDPQSIHSFVLQIDFRFDETRQSEHVPGLELPAYDAHAVIIDDRGKTHTGNVPEWWRYG